MHFTCAKSKPYIRLLLKHKSIWFTWRLPKVCKAYSGKHTDQIDMLWSSDQTRFYYSSIGKTKGEKGQKQFIRLYHNAEIVLG